MLKNIIILILILGFIAIVIFLDMPEIQGILDLRKNIKNEKELFLEKQDISAKVEKLREDYKANEENIKKVNYILPSDKDIPNLIVQLEALAFEGGMILENFDLSTTEERVVSRAAEVRTQEEVQIKDYQILVIDLKLIGDYSGLKRFLEAIEENMRLMDIESITLSPQSEGALLFDFEIIIKTYYQ